MKRTVPVKRVTLQDIARETGVSVNTVSHALRDKDDISEETRERIQAVAKQMGYTGDKIASSLRSGRTRTFAVILGNMSNPFYAIFTDMIQDAAREKGYTVLSLCSREQKQLEAELVRTAVAHRVDGILLFPTTESMETISFLKQIHMPFVLMTRTFGGDVADCIISDEEDGACAAVHHLIRNGRRKLGYMVQQNIVFSYEQRLNGFIRACDEAGIPQQDRRFYLATDEEFRISREDWHKTLLEQLICWRNEGVDGIFAFCDTEAMSIQGIIRQAPELSGWDVGIVGYDNIQGTQNYCGGLCSVDWPYREMAQEAVRILRARIKGDTRPPQTIVCKAHLVCNHSC